MLQLLTVWCAAAVLPGPFTLPLLLPLSAPGVWVGWGRHTSTQQSAQPACHQRAQYIKAQQATCRHALHLRRRVAERSVWDYAIEQQGQQRTGLP